MKKTVSSLQIQIVLTVLSIILFLFKAIAYYYTHSLAILSDALESIINIATAAFGIYALQLASKPQDAEHPYGHGKVEFISAGIEGSFILIPIHKIKS